MSLSLLDDTPVTATKISIWTARDPLLSNVVKFVLQGWPNDVPQEYSQYSRHATELSVQKGCLLWGARVVIPPQGRETLLNEFHSGHPGIVR